MPTRRRRTSLPDALLTTLPSTASITVQAKATAMAATIIKHKKE